MARTPTYEVVVVGGGPAGLTTAVYTTRLGHRTALVNREGGRYTRVNDVHNLIGVSEAVSGGELTEIAIRQIEEYGTDYYEDAVTSITPVGNDAFRVEANRADLHTERVVLATGFEDVSPEVPELRRFTGHGLHYCLHCDAYTLADESVYVLGHTASAANVAMVMLNFTDDVDLILNGTAPEWSEGVDEQVRAHPLELIEQEVVSAFPDDETEDPPWIGGLTFGDGTTREYVGGFAMYGTKYNNSLAKGLDCELNADGSIAVDDDYRTSVDGVYAVGDVTHGQNQTTVVIGDGAYAGIALHKDLRTFPLSSEEAAAVDGTDVPTVADDLRARMRRVREFDSHAGLQPSDQQ